MNDPKPKNETLNQEDGVVYEGGNFSRNSFNEKNHYVSVRLQQGVPLLDSDWNEMDDIRRFELQFIIKNFIGDGIPKENGGFKITDVQKDGEYYDFTIQKGSQEGPGCCLVDGKVVKIEENCQYRKQNMPKDKLSSPKKARTDLVYLDVWEQMVKPTTENGQINPDINIQTCVRLKREWVVRVVEGHASLTDLTPLLIQKGLHKDGHVYYSLATITWDSTGNPTPKNSNKKISSVKALS